MPRKTLRALQREVAGELVRSTDRTTIAVFESEYGRYLDDGLVRPQGSLVDLCSACATKLAAVRAEHEGDKPLVDTMELLISEVWRMKAETKA